MAEDMQGGLDVMQPFLEVAILDVMDALSQLPHGVNNRILIGHNN